MLNNHNQRKQLLSKEEEDRLVAISQTHGELPIALILQYAKLDGLTEAEERSVHLKGPKNLRQLCNSKLALSIWRPLLHRLERSACPGATPEFLFKSTKEERKDECIDAVVIGGGPIGLLCALQIRAAQPGWKITVLEGRSADKAVLRAQALRLWKETIDKIDAKLPVALTVKEKGCDVNSAFILSVKDLQTRLMTGCREKCIDIYFSHHVQFFLPSDKSVLLKIANRMSMAARFVVLATGYHSAVPPNVFGDNPYLYHGSEGRALVGYCESLPLKLSNNAPRCSQFLPSGDFGFLPKPLQVPETRVIFNYSAPWLTVAVGSSMDAFSNYVSTTVECTSLSDVLRKNNCNIEFNSPMTSTLLLEIVQDGLRSVDNDLVLHCSILVEWLHYFPVTLTQLHQGHEASIKFFMFHIHASSVYDVEIRIQTTVDFAKVAGQLGVHWVARKWFVRNITLSNLDCSLTDIGYPEQSFLPSNLLFDQSQTSSLPSFLFTKSANIPKFCDVEDNEDQDESSMHMIDLGYCLREFETASRKKLLEDARHHFMQSDSAAEQGALQFESSVVDIRIRYLPKPAICHNDAIVLAYGDCARSPNFFGASGVNIAIKGLDAIGRACHLFTQKEFKTAVDCLNKSGQELTELAILDHERVYGKT